MDRPTPDGDTVIEILTNLPVAEASAATVAELYRGRWTIEGLFQRLATVPKGEVNTLGYPSAAPFGFCVALASRNVYAAVTGAVRATHPGATPVSDYHIGLEIAGMAPGLEIAVPDETWAGSTGWSAEQMAAWLREVVRGANLKRYWKGTRGPKKPKARRTRFAAEKHIATARLLRSEQK
ncbi:MAG: Transposase domain protein [Gemmataceae bacterium]|nr:Transposase domain protein [Gemmataceae bacterium]